MAPVHHSSLSSLTHSGVDCFAGEADGTSFVEVRRFGVRMPIGFSVRIRHIGGYRLGHTGDAEHGSARFGVGSADKCCHSGETHGAR